MLSTRDSIQSIQVSSIIEQLFPWKGKEGTLFRCLNGTEEANVYNAIYECPQIETAAC